LFLQVVDHFLLFTWIYSDMTDVYYTTHHSVPFHIYIVRPVNLSQCKRSISCSKISSLLLLSYSKSANEVYHSSYHLYLTNRYSSSSKNNSRFSIWTLTIILTLLHTNRSIEVNSKKYDSEIVTWRNQVIDAVWR
jgi:hypothetical protein